MHLGVSMWSYFANWKRGELDIPGFIRECKRLEVDGVELLDFFWKDRAAETPAVFAALEETALLVGVYSVSNNFVNADPAVRREHVDVIKRGVDSALEYGAGTVRVFAGNPIPDVSFEDAFGWIVEGLAAGAAYAYENDVVLALENHGKLAGRSDQVTAILNAVGSPALKANPDSGNFLLVHQASHEAFADLATRAGMVHFKDFRAVPDDYPGFAYTSIDELKFAGTAVGEGEVALQECLIALHQAGFDGWLNIEYEAEENPLAGVARSVVNTKHLLESIS